MIQQKSDWKYTVTKWIWTHIHRCKIPVTATTPVTSKQSSLQLNRIESLHTLESKLVSFYRKMTTARVNELKRWINSKSFLAVQN